MLNFQQLKSKSRSKFYEIVLTYFDSKKKQQIAQIKTEIRLILNNCYTQRITKSNPTLLMTNPRIVKEHQSQIRNKFNSSTVYNQDNTCKTNSSNPKLLLYQNRKTGNSDEFCGVDFENFAFYSH